MRWIRYLPVMILLIISALGAFAIVRGLSLGLSDFVRLFMGLTLSQFSMLKLFHLPKFADGFQMYDLVAKRSRVYAYLYPFIELGLGLGYLSSASPLVVNLITVGVAAVGSSGVILALKRGLDVRCACMGTILDVPLSTVTLLEDIGMGVMAILMLLFL